LARYDQALGLFRAVGDRLGEANVLQAQGDVYRAQGDHEQAHSSYQDALALYRQIGARQGEANAYLGLGRLALAQDQMDEARRWTEQAIALHTANQSRYDVALDCETLAEALAGAGETEAAVGALRRAVANYAEINLLDRAASALTQLAGVLDDADRKEEACPIYASIVELQPDEAMWRRNYADSLIKLGRLDEATAQLDAAEALDPESPYLALRRAELAKARGDREGAARWAQEALRRRPDWDEAQAVLAWAQG
jgi:tetratricopeptide (TPR) repeat protein